jgi:large subunit ribosomal protein L27
MSKTKAAGTSRLGRDSQPKYLGVKLFAGQKTKIGSIIIKQRGSKFVAGTNVRKGSDDTLYAVKVGTVSFASKQKKCFDGTQKLVKVVNVTEK